MFLFYFQDKSLVKLSVNDNYLSFRDSDALHKFFSCSFICFYYCSNLKPVVVILFKWACFI